MENKFREAAIKRLLSFPRISICLSGERFDCNSVEERGGEYYCKLDTFDVRFYLEDFIGHDFEESDNKNYLILKVQSPPEEEILS